MEENPSSRYAGYSQDINYLGKRMYLIVDTLIMCEICKTQMYVSKVNVDKGLDSYTYPGGSTLVNGILNIELELICLKCGARKLAMGQDIKADEKTIRIMNVKEVGEF